MTHLRDKPHPRDKLGVTMESWWWIPASLIMTAAGILILYELFAVTT